MLQRTILRLIRTHPKINQHSFSTSNSPPTSQQDPQQPQTNPKTPPEQQRREGERDVEDEDVPFESSSCIIQSRTEILWVGGSTASSSGAVSDCSPTMSTWSTTTIKRHLSNNSPEPYPMLSTQPKASLMDSII